MPDDLWFKPLVWIDYKLAVLFSVILPLVLLIWALIKRSEAITRLLIIYWRVASLLMIALYLLIPAWRLGFVASFAARILIPIALWFWVDLNEEISDRPPDLLKLALTAWRWAMTVYCTLGAIAFIPFLSCAFTANVAETATCRVWLEAPWLYKALLHNDSSPGVLGFFGAVGLCFYIVYFAYFLLIRLGRQGRSAMEQ
ncbi:MAG: DUF3177 family protein [Jaaginema sp. PMC 1079.18]|nr:DUF3177 family protein [Jaaginema sp. PMC 1080.18]MEC4851211.1 DUF3177 family protein [Jaaginema sp. PMC 1079.18]MEC4865684.1 DUF3177 family protein [Jaaginema sp. PMC 1078.18]